MYSLRLGSPVSNYRNQWLKQMRGLFFLLHYLSLEPGYLGLVKWFLNYQGAKFPLSFCFTFLGLIPAPIFSCQDGSQKSNHPHVPPPPPASRGFPERPSRDFLSYSSTRRYHSLTSGSSGGL